MTNAEKFEEVFGIKIDEDYPSGICQSIDHKICEEFNCPDCPAFKFWDKEYSMNIQDLIKQLHDMVLLYGNRIVLTITDGQNEYSIKEITGNQCAKYFEPSDNVAEVVIAVSRK